MTLTKGPSGIWEGDFRRTGVKRLHLSLGTRDKKVARRRHENVDKLFRQKRHTMIEQVRSGALPLERLDAMIEHHEPLTPVDEALLARERAPWGTVDQAVERYLSYLAEHPNRSEGTHAIATTQLKPFAEFLYDGIRTGDRPVDAIPRALIEAYQRSYTEAGRSPNVVTTNMTRVGALWRWLVAEEARDANEERREPRSLYSPIARDRMPRDYRPRERFLLREEIELLRAATPEQLEFPVMLGLGMGLRRAEVTNLRRVDIDLELGAVSIRRHEDWQPKTRRSTRVLPMTDELLGIARRHLARWASEHRVVPGRDPRKPISDDGFGRLFKQIVERAGITYGRDNPEGVTFHTLRHTFASHAAMSGVDLYTLAQLLGDALDTVEKTYAHLSPDFKRAALAKVGAAIKMTQPLPQKPEESGA